MLIKARSLTQLDDCQITHLICVRLKHMLYDFLVGVLGLLKKKNNRKKAQNPPLKSHIENVLVRKIPVSVKFLSAILGPEMATPILWTPGKMPSFCRKTSMSIKFLVFGGGFWVWGGECRFYFYGRGDFSDLGGRRLDE